MDPAVRFFREDAKKQGMTFGKYLREHGIMYGWRWKTVRNHEDTVGLVVDE